MKEILTLVNKGHVQRDTLQVCWDEPQSTFISEFNLFFEGFTFFIPDNKLSDL